MKNTKKGFTLVELLVVIAIVAILATVAIIGYTSFTKKAEESNDRTLVAQLNKTLIGGEFADAHDAFEAVRAAGFDVAKIDATAKNQEILWDNDNKQFFYTADETRTGDIWIVDDEVNSTYSTYYIGTEDITTDLAAKIVVYTNDAALSLKVTAPNAHVEHEGIAGSIEVLAVANNSYYENGIVNALEVTTGKIVINGAVATLKVVGTANVNLSAGSETVKVIVNDATATVKADANAEVGNIATEVESVLDSLGTIVDGADDVIVDAVVDADKLGDFAGGFGTAQFPYLIVNAEQLQNVGKYYESFNYFKVADGVTEIDCNGWTSVSLCGVFDGNGVHFINTNDNLFRDVYGESAEIKNFTVTFKNSDGGVVYFNTAKNLTMSNINVYGTIEGSYNISSLIDYAGANNQSEHHIVMDNCHVFATIIMTNGGAGAYVGHPYSNADSTFALTNCTFEGHMYSSQGASACKVFSGLWVNGTVTVDGVAINANASLNNDQCHGITKLVGTLPEKYSTFSASAHDRFHHAVAILTISPNGNGTTVLGGGYSNDFIVEDLTAVDGTLTTSLVKYYDITVNGDATTETGVSEDGNTYNIVNEKYNNEYANASVRIIQYDANDNILSITVWTLPVEK